MGKYSSFNEEQIRILKENPYTLSVTQSRISVTLEAKKLILELYQAGWTCRRIVEELGYDSKYWASNARRTWCATSGVRQNQRTASIKVISELLEPV